MSKSGKKMLYLNSEDLTDIVNDCLDVYLDEVKKENVIHENAYRELRNKYRVVVHKKDFFGRMLSKIFDDEDFNISIVKIVNTEEKK